MNKPPGPGACRHHQRCHDRRHLLCRVGRERDLRQPHGARHLDDRTRHRARRRQHRTSGAHPHSRRSPLHTRRTGAQRGRARHVAARPAAVQRRGPARSARAVERHHHGSRRGGAARPHEAAPGPAAGRRRGSSHVIFRRSELSGLRADRQDTPDVMGREPRPGRPTGVSSPARRWTSEADVGVAEGPRPEPAKPADLLAHHGPAGGHPGTRRVVGRCCQDSLSPARGDRSAATNGATVGGTRPRGDRTGATFPPRSGPGVDGGSHSRPTRGVRAPLRRTRVKRFKQQTCYVASPTCHHPRGPGQHSAG
jgi:hypothetical protein